MSGSDQPISDDLVDPSLDLEPVPGLTGVVTGWRDRRTGMTFEWEALVVHVFDPSKMTFRITSPALPKMFLVVAHLQRISREVSPKKISTYELSKSDLFLRIEELLDEKREIAETIISRFGGRGDFLDYCLKAIIACHLKYMRTDTTSDGREQIIARRTADAVAFEIVE